MSFSSVRVGISAPSLWTALVVLVLVNMHGSARILGVVVFCIIACVVMHRECGLRIFIGVMLGLLCAAQAIYRVEGQHTRVSAALPAEKVVWMRGRLADDAYFSSGGKHRLPLALSRVGAANGWEASASGVITVFWDGSEYLNAGDTSALPMRGDTITVSNVLVSCCELPAIQSAHWKNLRLEKNDSFIGTIRRSMRNNTIKNIFRLPQTSKALLLALLLGYRNELSPELIEAVRSSGASHVLALSGMHLGVLALILRTILSKLFRKTVVACIILPVLSVYVWVVGWIPSLVRALVLCYVAALGRLTHHELPFPFLIAQTIIVSAFIKPEFMYNAGFLLSITALLGIVVIAPILIDMLLPYMPRRIAQYLGVSGGAITAAGAVSLSFFGVLYPSGLLFAGILSLLIIGEMWLGMLFLVTAYVPLLSDILERLLTWNAVLFQAVAALGKHIPALSLWQGIIFLLMIYGLIAVKFLRQRKNEKHVFNF